MVAPYAPPFAITPAIVALIADIAERIGQYAQTRDSAAALRLRRINRIRTIQGSLAIEGNTLSEQQITAILEGKRVIVHAHQDDDYYRALADGWRSLPPHLRGQRQFVEFGPGLAPGRVMLPQDGREAFGMGRFQFRRYSVRAQVRFASDP